MLNFLPLCTGEHEKDTVYAHHSKGNLKWLSLLAVIIIVLIVAVVIFMNYRKVNMLFQKAVYL